MVRPSQRNVVAVVVAELSMETGRWMVLHTFNCCIQLSFLCVHYCFTRIKTLSIEYIV